MPSLFSGPEIKVTPPPPAPGPPPLNPAERALQQAQVQALQQGLDQSRLSRLSFIAATGITPEEATAEQAQNQLLLSRGLSQRFQSALSGTLPVDPGLERSIATQRHVLLESLRRKEPGGFVTDAQGNVVASLSSGAEAALSDFDQRAEELRAAARTGAITEAEQVGFASSPLTQQVQYAAQIPLQNVGQFLGQQQGLLNQNQLAGYQAYNQYLASLLNAQAGAAGAGSQAAGLLGAGLLGTAGSVLGPAFGYGGRFGQPLSQPIGTAGGRALVGAAL